MQQLTSASALPLGVCVDLTEVQGSKSTLKCSAKSSMKLRSRPAACISPAGFWLASIWRVQTPLQLILW